MKGFRKQKRTPFVYKFYYSTSSYKTWVLSGKDFAMLSNQRWETLKRSLGTQDEVRLSRLVARSLQFLFENILDDLIENNDIFNFPNMGAKLFIGEKKAHRKTSKTPTTFTLLGKWYSTIIQLPEGKGYGKYYQFRPRLSYRQRIFEKIKSGAKYFSQSSI